MTDIHVTRGSGDEYAVEIRDAAGTSRHRVTVSAGDRSRYGGDASAEALLEASFRFLLEREPKEAILSRFEISVIERFFPEYPAEIRHRLG
ncbi:MAG: hypothetical protein ACODAB_02945 [Gemmatimonadota bacterium]